jgi:hypothetical protein
LWKLKYAQIDDVSMIDFLSLRSPQYLLLGEPSMCGEAHMPRQNAADGIKIQRHFCHITRPNAWQLECDIASVCWRTYVCHERAYSPGTSKIMPNSLPGPALKRSGTASPTKVSAEGKYNVGLTNPAASILVVGDEALDRKLLETLLAPEGYIVDFRVRMSHSPEKCASKEEPENLGLAQWLHGNRWRRLLCKPWLNFRCKSTVLWFRVPGRRIA